MEYIDYIPRWGDNYKINKSGHHWYDEIPTGYSWYDETCFIPARKPNRFKNCGYEYGFVLNEERVKRIRLAAKGEQLRAAGWKGHRNGYVPCTSRYKNLISAKRSNGFKAEVQANKDAQFYPWVLVRAKRSFLAREGIDWDFYDRQGNQQRGWKRTKKAKQWM